MRITTLSQLHEIKRTNPELFHNYLDICGDRLNFLKLVYGYDFWNFHDNMPETYQELANNFFRLYKNNPQFAKESITWLGEYIEKGIKREVLSQEEPSMWNYQSLPLEKRIILEMINRHGMMEDYKLGFYAKQRLIDVMQETEVSRDHYYRATVIFENEMDDVARKYGEASILNSLNIKSKRYQQLIQKITKLKEFLDTLTLEKRIHPLEIKKENPKMHRLALALYTKFECATKHLCEHSFSILNNEIVQNAYRIYVEQGEQETVTFLKYMKCRDNNLNNILEYFSRRYNNFRGLSSNVNTSVFERFIEQEMIKEGIFYRRQVPYHEIASEEYTEEIDKRMTADYCVGNTIIEIIDNEDGFIHDKDYFERLERKKQIALQSGKSFIALTNNQDYKKTLQKIAKESFIPEETYDLGTITFNDDIEESRLLTTTTATLENHRKKHFCNNVFMIGYLERNNALQH